MSYELLSTVNLLNNTLQLVTVENERMNAAEWVQKKFGFQQVLVRMNWGVSLLGLTAQPNLPTSESVILARLENKGLGVFYRENFQEGPQGAGLHFCTLSPNMATIHNIKAALNGLFLKIDNTRNSCLFSQDSGLSRQPVCPQART